MDYSKPQVDILKALVKDKLPRFVYKYIDNDIWFTTDGIVMYKIPKDKFCVNIDRFQEANVVKNRIADLKDSHLAESVVRGDIEYSKTINEALILTYKDLKVYVNYKLIKPFESKKNKLTFSVTDVTGVVGVYENDEIVGIVMPFRCDSNTLIINERSCYNE